MPKVGDKFIIEIGEIYSPKDSNSNSPSFDLYRIEGFNSLVFDDFGIQKLLPYDAEAAYQRGVNAGQLAATGESYAQGLKDGCEVGWDFAKKVTILPDEAKREIFGTAEGNTINMGYTYREAREAVDAYERTHFCVGDIVEYNDGSRGLVVKVTRVDRNCMLYHVLWSDGNTGDYYSDDEILPTNRRFDLSELFNALEDRNEGN